MARREGRGGAESVVAENRRHTRDQQQQRAESTNRSAARQSAADRERTQASRAATPGSSAASRTRPSATPSLLHLQRAPALTVERAGSRGAAARRLAVGSLFSELLAWIRRLARSALIPSERVSEC